jgi:hypothetical protein
MSDWKRATHEISFYQVPVEVKSEFQRHIELYKLGNILSDTVICVQTDAEKAKKGLFGTAESNRIIALLTPRWLIWIVSGNKTPATVTSALLKDIVIQDYASTSLAKMMPDSGIDVSGKFTDVSESISAFIGLENNTAGQRFKELAISAVQNAKE